MRQTSGCESGNVDLNPGSLLVEVRHLRRRCALSEHSLVGCWSCIFFRLDGLPDVRAATVSTYQSHMNHWCTYKYTTTAKYRDVGALDTDSRDERIRRSNDEVSHDKRTCFHCRVALIFAALKSTTLHTHYTARQKRWATENKAEDPFKKNNIICTINTTGLKLQKALTFFCQTRLLIEMQVIFLTA